MTWSGASTGEHFVASNPPTGLSAIINVKDSAYGAKGDTKTFTAGAMTNTQSTLTDTTNAPFVVADVGKKIDIYPTKLITPEANAFDYSTTGGSLAAGTYWYRLASRNAFGSTLASVEMFVVIPVGTSTNRAIVGWNAVTGSTSTDIFGRTAGAEQLIANVGAGVTQYIDTGAITPSGALPASNTTANSAMTLSGLTITGFNSASSVTLSSPATATVAGQSYSFGTDDTAALQSAIGASRKIVVPAGTYWISNTLNFTAINDWCIEGVGKGASILRRGNAVNQHMVNVQTGCTRWYIQDLGFDQNGVTNNGSGTCHGIYQTTDCDDGVVQGNHFINSPGFAIFTFGGPGNWSHNLRVWNNDVTCLDGATIDVISVTSKGGSSCFNRVFATANLAYNIYECRDHPCVANTIFLNGQTGVGIRVSSSLGCPVSLNTVNGATNDYGIQIMKETDNATATPQTEALIDGNTLRGSHTFICFGLSTNSGTVIRNNLCDGNFVVVNYISGAIQDVAFEGNKILGNTNSVFSGSASTPLVYRDNIGYNPLGVAAITPGASPYTYTAGPTDEVVYIVGGTVTFIVKNGITLGTGTSATVPTAVPLLSGESVVVTYSVVPTMNKDRK